MISCALFFNFLHLRSKYSPQHPVLKHPQSMSLSVRNQISHPYKTTRGPTNLHLLVKWGAPEKLNRDENASFQIVNYKEV